MDVTPLIRAGQQVIQNYADGRFRIGGKIYDGAVIVFPEHTVSWPAPDDLNGLTAENFSLLIEKAGSLDVVLLGCGKTMKFLDSGLKKALKDKGLSVDVMDTGAACRTYNVLMAEGRRVAAALLPYL